MAAPAAGPQGRCQPDLAEAIWDFQQFWKSQGLFRNIDSVVDPAGNTLKQLNALTGRGPNLRPDLQRPDLMQKSLFRVLALRIAGAPMLGPRPSNYAGTIHFFEAPLHGVAREHIKRIRLSGSEVSLQQGVSCTVRRASMLWRPIWRTIVGRFSCPDLPRRACCPFIVRP